MAGPAGHRSAWEPTSAAAVTSDVPAPIAGDVTRRPGVASDHGGPDAEWLRLWEAAPESVRWAFAKCLNRLAMPRPVLYDNFIPLTERRVETLLTLYARRLLDSAPRGGR